MKAGLTISKAAEAAGVGIETIRFYERERLIEQPLARKGSGPRRYSPEIVQRIRSIQEAQRVGFSLREVREFLALEAEAATGGPRVKERAAYQLVAVRSKLRQLQRLSAALRLLAAGATGPSVLSEALSGRADGFGIES
jgi:MerR family copper efflux transcriptional regulator